MREILFRGKRLDNGEWIEGFYYANPALERRLYGERHWIISDENGLSYEVDPSTVGQYTGLVDKNGKRIFEGDIVRGPHISDDLMTEPVEFSAVCGWMPFDYLREDLCEVIGNIHDNLGLLEVTHDA